MDRQRGKERRKEGVNDRERGEGERKGRERMGYRKVTRQRNAELQVGTKLLESSVICIAFAPQ